MRPPVPALTAEICAKIVSTQPTVPYVIGDSLLSTAPADHVSVNVPAARLTTAPSVRAVQRGSICSTTHATLAPSSAAGATSEGVPGVSKVIGRSRLLNVCASVTLTAGDVWMESRPTAPSATSSSTSTAPLTSAYSRTSARGTKTAQAAQWDRDWCEWWAGALTALTSPTASSAVSLTLASVLSATTATSPANAEAVNASLVPVSA